MTGWRFRAAAVLSNRLNPLRRGLGMIHGIGERQVAQAGRRGVAPVVAFPSGAPVSGALNGVELAPWRDHPADPVQWELPEMINPCLTEPPLEEGGKLLASGAVIIEPDHRVWVAHLNEPFNAACVGFPTARKDPNFRCRPRLFVRPGRRPACRSVSLAGWAISTRRLPARATTWRPVSVGRPQPAAGNVRR